MRRIQCGGYGDSPDDIVNVVGDYLSPREIARLRRLSRQHHGLYNQRMHQETLGRPVREDLLSANLGDGDFRDRGHFSSWLRGEFLADFKAHPELYEGSRFAERVTALLIRALTVGEERDDLFRPVPGWKAAENFNFYLKELAATARRTYADVAARALEILDGHIRYETISGDAPLLTGDYSPLTLDILMTQPHVFDRVDDYFDPLPEPPRRRYRFADEEFMEVGRLGRLEFRRQIANARDEHRESELRRVARSHLLAQRLQDLQAMRESVQRDL